MHVLLLTSIYPALARVESLSAVLPMLAWAGAGLTALQVTRRGLAELGVKERAVRGSSIMEDGAEDAEGGPSEGVVVLYIDKRRGGREGEGEGGGEAEGEGEGEG